MAVTARGHLEDRLHSIFSSDQISTSERSVPAPFTVFPQRKEQICELVKMAREDSFTLFPIGGGTHLFPSTKPMDICVSLSRIEERIEHYPADLTGTFPVGMSFETVQMKLKEHHQTIPLDPPITSVSSVGGVISANTYGPRCHRHGTARDWVIATTLVNGEGNIVKAGAKVVKNVSGYDLNKLYIGARGTLGILLDISFKLYPIPEKRVTFRSSYDTVEKALDAASAISKSHLDVEALVILKGEWTPEKVNHWWMLVDLAGPKEGLEPQVNTLSSIHDKSGTRQWEIISKEDAFTLWKMAKKAKPSNIRPTEYQQLLVKIILTRSGLRKFLLEFAIEEHSNLSFKVLPTVGICYLSFSQKIISSEDIQRRITDPIRSIGGTVEFESIPENLDVNRWPLPPSSLEWMRRIKKALDPHSIFAPHTFVGGI